MERLIHSLNSFLDMLFFGIIAPLFTLIGQGLEFLILHPMQALQFPPALQIGVVSLLTALLSLGLRKLIKAEEKEQAFREKFVAKKRQQEELHLISDWKSREKFAKAMDDDIDEDFNTYLAGRFARYGIAYLLPLFLVLYWLETTTGYTGVISLPENRWGLTAVPMLVVFLVSYCSALLFYFKAIKKKKALHRRPALAV